MLDPTLDESAAPDNVSGFDYCADLLHGRDPDRFFAALLAPREKRSMLVGLLALNSELARARSAVSEPHIGFIRLQWWQDALDEIEAGKPVRAHPITQVLAGEHARGPGLDFARLRGLIDARDEDMSDTPFASQAGLAAYVDATGGALHALLAACLSAQDDELQQAASIGRAWAYTGLARAAEVDQTVATKVGPFRDRLVALAKSDYASSKRSVSRRLLPAVAVAGFLPAYWRLIAAGKTGSTLSMSGRILRLGGMVLSGRI